MLLDGLVTAVVSTLASENALELAEELFAPVAQRREIVARLLAERREWYDRHGITTSAT
jgi:hypothetical protein